MKHLLHCPRCMAVTAASAIVGATLGTLTAALVTGAWS